jgi:ribonuclease M5
LLAALPNAKVIAIDKRWFKNQSKIGLAELDEKHMRNLFNDLIGELTVKPTLTWNDYQALPLDTRNARIQLCAKLSIPYFNHLQLFKILNLLKFNQAKIKYII